MYINHKLQAPSKTKGMGIRISFVISQALFSFIKYKLLIAMSNDKSLQKQLRKYTNRTFTNLVRRINCYVTQGDPD